MIEDDTSLQKNVWDRFPDESERAYHAFECYLEMPPGERSFEEAYRIHTGNLDAAAPSDTFKGWVKRYNWKERVAAYDDHVRRLRRQAHERGMVREAEQLGARIERLQENLLDAAEKSHEKTLDILRQDLDAKNYNMGHAVQMGRFVLETYKTLLGVQAVSSPEDDEWTEEDDEMASQFLEEFDQKRWLASPEDTTSEEQDDPEKPE